MYCTRMKCHVNFDPGGKTSMWIIFVVFILGILRFNEVNCSAATSTGDERWQRRQEFAEASHAPVRYMDSALHSALPDSPSNLNYKTSNSISGQTKDESLWFQPDESTRHPPSPPEHHAIKSLSAPINIQRKPMNESVTTDLAADIPLPRNDFITDRQRTKSFQDEDEVNEWEHRDREEKLKSSIKKKPKKPSIIHKVDIQGDNLNWSRGSILNVRSNEHRQLDKREVGNEPKNDGEPSKNLPTIKNTSSDGNEQTSIGTPPKSTPTSTAAQTTTPKPKTPSTSILSTVKQLITTISQETSSRTSSSVHVQQPTKPTTLQTHTSHIRGTVEGPTTDAAIEESSADCEGAQCYASRFPYHWTTDASWALASMVFLMSVLTFFVLYTGLWKKRNPMSYPLDSSQPPSPNPKINIADLLKTRLAMIPRHLRSKRQVHRKRMNGRRYEELPLHQSNGSCNDEELDYFEDEEEDDLYLRDEHTV